MPLRPLALAALAALLAALTTATPGAARAPAASQRTQDTTPTFRSAVRWIDVDAVVQDRDGRFVTGLTRADFELYEDRQPQTLDRVTLVDLASAPGIVPDTAPDPVTAADPFAQAGRLYVMLLDSGQPPVVTAIARTFIERYLGPTDMMAVVNVHSGVAQGLTSDRQRLLTAVGGYSPPRSRTFLSQEATYRTLREVIVNLGAVTGRRKSVLLVGTGSDLWPGLGDERTPFEDIPDLWRLVNETTRTARAFNVPIHAISADRHNVQLRRPMPLGFDAEPVDLPAFEFEGGDLPSAQDDRAQGLRLLAHDTRGVDVVFSSVADGFRRIVDENSRYYMLGYYSTVERDDRTHRIDVRVKGRPDLTVRARRDFRLFSPETKAPAVGVPDATSAAVRAALRHAPAPRRTGTIEIVPLLFRGNEYRGSILVESIIRPERLQLATGGRLEISTAAFDAADRLVGADTRAFHVSLQPGTRTRLAHDRLHAYTRLSLPRGAYRIRVALQESGGEVALAETTVTIPDFTEDTLTFSDILLGRPGGTPLTLLADDVLRRTQAGRPIHGRRFAPGEQMTIFAEIYDSHWLLSPTLGVKWSIRRGDGTPVAEGEDHAGTIAGGRAFFTGSVRLIRMTPGEYVLTLEAYSVGGPPASATQQVRFEVTTP